ncbi:MAG TPA: hypothetical protein VE869_15225 [Gemmatimonas sp.]|nr:hypothetical protein [Gemmatimonas sp.]
MTRSRIALPILFATLTLVTVGPLRAQSAASDSTAVVAVVQRLFDAMAKSDTAMAHALLMPGTRFVSLLSDTSTSMPRAQSDTSFLRSLVARPQRLLERMWSPIVHVQGPIATLWAPYDFHVNGQFSHCGIDTATLVRGASGWQIASLVYTVQRRGCAPSPLGVPRSGS